MNYPRLSLHRSAGAWEVRPQAPAGVALERPRAPARVAPLMGSLIKKRRKRMRKKKHKKMLKRTRWQRRAAGK